MRDMIPVSRDQRKSTGEAVRTIGFLVSDTDPAYYGQLLNTLRDVCLLMNVRIVVFEGRTLYATALAPRCYNAVYNLVSQNRLDGLLVATSGMGAICGPDQLDAFLTTLSLPIVTIGMPLPHACGVTVDDDASVRLVLDHLLQHGFRRIIFASGPPQIIHSKERLEAYQRWIVDADPVMGLREDIMYGTFTARSGYDIMALLHPRVGKSLDAVCFANDSMALGALEYCNTYGIRVPEELAIVGIDNIELASIVAPGLTTVSQNMPRMAQLAVRELLEEIDVWRAMGDSEVHPSPSSVEEKNRTLLMEPRRLTAAPTLIRRGSCGCEPRMIPNRNALLQDMMNRTLYIGESVQTFDSGELFSRMEEFLRRKSVSMCFVLIFENLPQGMDCHQFVLPALSRMLLGYVDGQRLSCEDSFPTNNLLPQGIWPKTGQKDLMIKPLFFENEVFGYLVSATDERERALVEDLRLMISVTLKGESLIKELQQTHSQLEWALNAMKTANLQLTDISLKDDLTGLLNRRGFLQETMHYLQSQPDRFLLGFADMNGLKGINDAYGHEEGDAALREIALILKQCSRDVDILARISGDEFAFVIKDMGWNQKDVLDARFEEKLAEWNMVSSRAYKLSFARGYSAGQGNVDLEALMKQSDARMYVHKAQQKREIQHMQT